MIAVARGSINGLVELLRLATVRSWRLWKISKRLLKEKEDVSKRR